MEGSQRGHCREALGGRSGNQGCQGKGAELPQETHRQWGEVLETEEGRLRRELSWGARAESQGDEATQGIQERACPDPFPGLSFVFTVTMLELLAPWGRGFTLHFVKCQAEGRGFKKPSSPASARSLLFCLCDLVLETPLRPPLGLC